jgi:nucleoside-triphosphatase THEP1
MEYQQNPELQLASDFVKYTNCNIYLTGKAGTGKTTFLHQLKETIHKRMIVVAPTGVAAINARGTTIHSFFQLAFAPHIPTDSNQKQGFENSSGNRFSNKIQKFNRDKLNIIKSLDLLVIDEISMVRADVLDAIDEVLRRYKDRFKPFGGVQLLMIGDIQQLAPVVRDEEWDILKSYYQSIFFFHSRALLQTKHVNIELKHIYRQSDKVFIDLLNKIRNNNIDQSTLTELNKRYIPNFTYNENEGYITLTTHNYQAQEINSSKLLALKNEPQNYTAEVQGEFPEYTYPTEFKLELKVGAQVMFVKNDSSREKLFYNGKIGKIIGFEEDSIMVKCDADLVPIPVVKQEWQNTKYKINETTKDITEEVIGSFIQYPLKLAWAITIHKSQGLTFEKAIIDANASFAHGQVYVALSRCKTLEGMVLSSPIAFNSIKNDVTVSSFSREVEENPPTRLQLDASKRDYELSLIYELFDFISLQRKLNYCLKIINENSASLLSTLASDVGIVLNTFKSDLLDVSERFKMQVKQLASDNQSVDVNAALQDRIVKACVYFNEKVKTILQNGFQSIVFDSDNKEVRKQLKDVVEKIHEETIIKLYCLNETQKGFSVSKYLENRAKAKFEKNEPKTNEKKNNDEVPNVSKHPQLYALLKKWRNAKADELNWPVYLVLPQKTLIELVAVLPKNTRDLKSISGMGAKKISQFGAEIIEIISEYIVNKGEDNESGEKIDIPEIFVGKTKQKKDKKDKPDTKDQTLQLFINGLSVSEIAVERSINIRTIEEHIAEHIQLGKIDVKQLVTVDKIAVISEYFTECQDIKLKPAKEVLGDDYSYCELRFVLSHLIYTKQIVEHNA